MEGRARALETSDNGYVVHDVEVAGNDGNDHEVKVDAGNAKILAQDLEDEGDESDAGESNDSDQELPGFAVDCSVKG